MKKFLSIMLLAIFALVLVACGNNAQKTLDEQVNALAITYADGENAANVKTNVTLNTISAEGFTVTWSTSNDKVVAADGKVVRPEAGQNDATVDLTATVSYKELTATKKFTLVVKAKDAIKPLSIEITGNDTMQKGKVYNLNATVAPETATDKTVTWASDNTSVATVDANGKVTAVELGTANITATANGDNTVKETFIVTVVEPVADTIADIQAKAAGEEAWAKGIVMAAYAKGFLVYDGTGSILVYMNNTAFTQKVGDYVEVKGAIAEYQGAKQFTETATIATPADAKPEYKISASKLKDGAATTAFMGAFEYAKKVSFRLTVSATSDSYINCVVKDSDVSVSICYPANKAAYEVGKDYDVVAYALYVKEYNSINTLYVMVDKAEEVDYGFDVNVTYIDGTETNVETINSLEFPILVLPEPDEKEGLVFLGWYKGTEEAPVKVFNIFVPEDITLFARWTTEADAPLFVDPACEDGSAYTSISSAVAVAKEGQEIYLAPGEYVEEYVKPVARVYNDVEALMEAYCADYRTTVGRSSGTIDLFETSTAESSWMTTMLSNAEMTQKWSWLYKAISEVAENEDMDPEIFSAADVRFNFMVNLYGLFSGTQHTDSGMKSYTSANFTDPGLAKKVLIAGPKVNAEETDEVANKIIINKKVTFVGPNANVSGYDVDNRNAEAEIKSAIEITAAGVVFDGCAFLGEGVIGLGANDITIVNCYIATEKYANGDVDNRKAEIYNMNKVRPVNTKILDSYFLFSGASYTSIAITAGNSGVENFTIDGCVFESTTDTPAKYECIFFYNVYGDLVITNNKFNFATSEGGYTLRLGLYGSYIGYALIKDNEFGGIGDNGTSKIAFEVLQVYNGKAGIIDIIHNKFNDVKPDTLVFVGKDTKDSTGIVINVKYNYFNDKENFSLTNSTKATVNFDYNCVLGTKAATSVIDPAAQANKYDTLEALEAGYETYKATADATNTITLDTDGGNTLAAITFANPYLVKLPTPVKEGFVFDGWYNGETKVEAITAKADVTLKAKWVTINTITFDVDGGSKVDAIEFTDYTKVGALPVSSKEGITFAGWYEGDTKVETITENRNYNLKAKWEGDYTLTYNTDGGNEITPIMFSDYTKVVLATPTKDGFDFVGWYNGETLYTALTENNSITLTAKWAKLYTITYDFNGGAIAGTTLDILSYGFARSYWASANHPTTVWLLSKAAGHYEGASYRYAYKWGLSYDAETKVFTVVASYPAQDIAAGDVSGIAEDYAIICNGSYANFAGFNGLKVGDKLVLSADVSTLTDGEVDLKLTSSITSMTVITSKLPNDELLTGVTKGEQILEGWYNGETKVTEITEAADITLTAKFMDKPTGLIYKTAAELGAAYIADWNAATGRSLTADKLDTDNCNSSDMTTALSNAEMNTKWAWLYTAINTATGNADMAIGTADVSTSAVKGYYFANLCGLFTQTKHTDTHLSTESFDWTNATVVEAVLAQGPTYED